MAFHSFAVPSVILFASLSMAWSARGECIRVPVEQVVNRQSIRLVFSGTVVSMTEIGQPSFTTGVKVTFEVDRIWKGSVGKRVELYMDLNAENPQFVVGHRSLAFAEYLIDREARQRVGLGGTDKTAFGSVPCTDLYSVSEITSILGPGEPPRTESRQPPALDGDSPVTKKAELQ